MLDSLARQAWSHPRRFALGALAVFVVAGIVGGPAAGKLNARNAFSDPGSQSARAQALVERVTGRETDPGVLAVVSAPPGSEAVTSVARTIGAVPAVASVVAPVAGAPSPLVSSDGHMSVVAATLKVPRSADNAVKAIEKALHGRRDVVLGGGDVANHQVNQQAVSDLGFAELVVFPLLFVLALLIFRGVAALLPLAVGGLSVLVTFTVLRLVNTGFALSTFALNLVIGLGLGLAVDYSLFLVWRFRDEIGRGATPEDALGTTLRTTGRTIIFSALTVAAALASLGVFPQRFLVSMGIGGAAVALVAAASSLLVLPALVALLGSRIARVRPAPPAGTWYRLARGVMRRPALVAIVTAGVLVALASPAPRVTWSGVDASVLPHSKSARVVQDLVTHEFPALHGGQAVLVVAHAPPTAGTAVARYTAGLAQVPGIRLVAPPRYLGSGVWRATLGGRSDAIAPSSQQGVERLRAMPAPFPVLIGGAAADFYDQRASIASSAPLALVILALVTLVILWLMTGSVILPFKALVMNALTAAAATGVLVFVFQDGRLTRLLSYASQGGIEETDFLILAALAFALSTDYGVFLLARIKEARAEAPDERDAIALGMQRTGRLITYASLLLAVAIGAFGTSRLVFLKELGVGGAVAVLLDAFVVRALLVPSLMALLGRWNWWSPGALRRLHAGIGVVERVEVPATSAS